MENRLDPHKHQDHDRLRLGITAIVLGMIPVVVIGVLVTGASYGVAGPLAGLVGLLAIKIVSYYFE